MTPYEFNGKHWEESAVARLGKASRIHGKNDRMHSEFVTDRNGAALV